MAGPQQIWRFLTQFDPDLARRNESKKEEIRAAW